MLWNEIKQQYKFLDGIIIGLLILLSFSPYVVFAISQKNSLTSTTQATAIISINGKEVDRFTLNSETPHQLKTYRQKKKKYNIIEIEGQRIRVKEDNSPDQIAVNTSWISRPGQTSVCLPHRFVIKIVGVLDEGEDELILTH